MTLDEYIGGVELEEYLSERFQACIKTPACRLCDVRHLVVLIIAPTVFGDSGYGVVVNEALAICSTKSGRSILSINRKELHQHLGRGG